MKKAILIVLFLIACAGVLYGQSEATLRGVVKARVDGSAVPGASVRLEGASPLETVAGTDGAFAFPRVTPGVYTVVVSHTGFAPERQQVTLRPREVATTALELSVQGLTQSVDVRTSMNAVGTIPNSTVLQSEEVERLPAPGKTNLTDMIASTAPGMIRSHDDFVHVRGNEISLNAFLNGVSFWENPHSVLSSGLTP